MECVKRKDAVAHEPSSHCTVYEYPMDNGAMNIAVAEIRQRYPNEGYAMNRECTEMGYVIQGSGKLVTESQTVSLDVGDVVLIPAGEKYYWEGDLIVVLPVAPAWHPEQHVT